MQPKTNTTNLYIGNMGTDVSLYMYEHIKRSAVSLVTEWLERLIFNCKVLSSNLSLPNQRSNRETSRGDIFCSVFLLSLP